MTNDDHVQKLGHHESVLTSESVSNHENYDLMFNGSDTEDTLASKAREVIQEFETKHAGAPVSIPPTDESPHPVNVSTLLSAMLEHAVRPAGRRYVACAIIAVGQGDVGELAALARDWFRLFLLPSETATSFSDRTDRRLSQAGL